jgi:hypothetical protein
MPMLNRIREDAVVKPFHPLKDMSDHAGAMKCVYADPPTLDQADWLEAEKTRPVRAIGMPLHQT